ncbi:MAG: DUF501 domain-containing protein [Actinobacteria bacterium]|nr:DUF501 domain-containing protein [Actinomycetota bacterium]
MAAGTRLAVRSELMDEAAIVAWQLGRTPRGPWRVVARCTHGYPICILTSPMIEGGEPFPTLYYLTCPHLVAEVSSLESSGQLEVWRKRLVDDFALAARLRDADEEYRKRRAAEAGGVDPTPGVGIAGQRGVLGTKCLHAHVAATLAGIGDPVGEGVLQAVASPECVRAECAGESVQPTERRAVIDIGTVTTRMLVADVTDGAIHEVVRRQTITHLGAGWAHTGRLSAEGIGRVASAVREFVTEAEALGAQRIAAAATAAARDAENRDEFCEAIASAGVRPEIISGDREGYLTFLGVSYGISNDRVLVVDVGGGSTEFVLGSSGLTAGERVVEIEFVRSVDIGSRRATELFLRSDPPTEGEIDEAASWITDELWDVFSAMRGRPLEMVAVAGTATSLAAIDLRLDPYDSDRIHGYRLSGRSLLDILERLAAMTLEERRHVVGLEPERAGVIVGGALILQAAMAYAGLSSTLVSEHDILYGMVLDLDGGGAS